MKRELGILLVAAGLVGACGGKGNSCVPGMSTACACSDGSRGAQVCRSDGTYGACACGGGATGNVGGTGSDDMGGTGGGGSSGTGGGGSSGTGGGGTGGAGDFGPLAIKNASARASGANGYNLSFVITNARAGDGYYAKQIDVVRFRWGSDMLSMPLDCGSPPWVTPNATTDVIQLTLSINGSTSAQTQASYVCGGSAGYHSIGVAQASPTGSIGIEVDGIMQDAAPFRATATAPIL